MAITLPARGSTGSLLPEVRTRQAGGSPTGDEIQDVILVNAAGDERGTATAPMRIDPTGGTTQPVTDAAVGATTDTKVQSDSSGSVVAFIRGIVSWLADLIETRAQTPTKTKAVNVQVGPGDVISNIPVVMDFDHHQIHEGESFRWSVLVPAAANTNTKYIKFVVPSIAGITDAASAVRKCPHFRFEVVSDAAADITFFEGTSSTGTGTQRTPVSMERNGSYTSSLEVWEDPTTVTEGTVIWRGMVAASKQIAGGIEGSQNEFVLKNNTTYFFKFAPVANNTKYLLRFVWYSDLGV